MKPRVEPVEQGNPCRIRPGRGEGAVAPTGASVERIFFHGFHPWLHSGAPPERNSNPEPPTAIQRTWAILLSAGINEFSRIIGKFGKSSRRK